MNLKFLLLLSFLSLSPIFLSAQSAYNKVMVCGAMSNVMKKGMLEGTIYLDSLSEKQYLYGLGPKEYLKGELLIIDGHSYLSYISAEGNIQIEETYVVKAPFFVYTRVKNWEKYALPKEITTLKQLEHYLDTMSQHRSRPFVFRLEGQYAKVHFHIQNLPTGTVIKSPQDAHIGQAKFERIDTFGEIIGFFSTQHQTIFTHHDSYIHMHFIDAARTEMGHIDDLHFDHASEIKLYLPKE